MSGHSTVHITHAIAEPEIGALLRKEVLWMELDCVVFKWLVQHQQPGINSHGRSRFQNGTWEELAIYLY
jgi:hypothetical protein